MAIDPNGGVPFDLSKVLSSFQPVARRPEPVPAPGAGPAEFKIGYPALAYSTAGTVRYCRTAAIDRELPNNFPAFRVRFSEHTQGMLLIPQADYSETDPELYPIRWSKNRRQFTVDLSEALVHKNWGTPPGYFRNASVHLFRNQPGVGSVLYVDLQNSSVKPRSKKKKDESENKPADAKKAEPKQSADKPAAPKPEVAQNEPPKAS